MNDSAEKYRRAVRGLSSVVEAVPADGWYTPSPCAGWTARQVVGHVIGGLRAVAAVEDGPPPDPDDPGVLAGGDPAAAFAAARDRALDVLTEDNLGRALAGPVGTIMLEQKVAMFSTPDVLIHTWDLARAAGIDVQLDPALVRETYAAHLPMDAMLRSQHVFGPRVECPEGADPQTALLCFTGRSP